jgi:nicotinamide-nucleotide amidase
MTKISQTHRIQTLAKTVIAKASAKGVMIATAESCTGGMIAAALTDVPGSSAVVERGFVTYSNEAKSEMLALPMALIEKRGAVSGEVAGAMATGAIKHSRAGIAVSVTGIAGPTGGSPGKPVGLVWFGLADRNGLVRIERRVFAGGSRAFVRTKTTETALGMILSRLSV